MMDKFKAWIKRYGWLIPIVLIIAAWFGGDRHGQKLVRDSLVSQTDTVTKTVTVYKDFPKPQETALVGYVHVPAYKFISDTVNAVSTVFLHDTTVVYLPREQRYYEEEDGRLRMWVSGYDPSLDRYELDKVETTITNTIVERPAHWALSVSAGYGAALHDKIVVLSPFIGIGISYNIISW